MQSADQVTNALAGWLRTRFTDIGLSLNDKADHDDKPAIRLELVDLYIESASNRLAMSAVLRLDYRITIATADILDVHRQLGEIAFALADNPMLDLGDGQPVILRMERSPPGVLGIAVSAALPRARTRALAPPVRTPPVVRVGGMGAIDGVVQGPDGGPVAGAMVEIASLQLRQITGLDGRFRFDTPPESEKPLELAARKHGFSQTVTAKTGQHLTLQLSLES